LSEERTITTGAKRLAVGAVAVAMLAVFGGVAYAQQERNGGGQDCPWGQQGGEGQP
jgi:hypothetical protein